MFPPATEENAHGKTFEKDFWSKHDVLCSLPVHITLDQ
ncbi:hypothetical protein LptCag_2522 [Leptospirillum ferriphilum]|uniref:Uncharacterized protein n=1 Tax=Leptospirillum ferriphilum TaxID=178606 RepID=A0A094WC15_9BACT|nr:hypothetical protein LptCag_2522 [Leptospirillum ferriphilum]